MVLFTVVLASATPAKPNTLAASAAIPTPAMTRLFMFFIRFTFLYVEVFPEESKWRGLPESYFFETNDEGYLNRKRNFVTISLYTCERKHFLATPHNFLALSRHPKLNQLVNQIGVFNAGGTPE